MCATTPTQPHVLHVLKKAGVYLCVNAGHLIEGHTHVGACGQRGRSDRWGFAAAEGIVRAGL